MFPDMTGYLRSAMPDLRGKLEANAPTAPLSWFRTGGPAQVLFTPEDIDDLAVFSAPALDSRHAPACDWARIEPAGSRRWFARSLDSALGKSFSDISVLPGSPHHEPARARRM